MPTESNGIRYFRPVLASRESTGLHAPPAEMLYVFSPELTYATDPQVAARMPRPLPLLPLSPGRVYRTRDLARWSRNPTRLAARLVETGVLRRLAHGLYTWPRTGRFGHVPPSDEELLRAFLGETPFVLTGPPAWNALGLGATAVHADTLVYNTKRSGTFQLGGRSFRLRRVAFPKQPPKEWFVVDLLRHSSEAGISRQEVVAGVEQALAAGRLDAGRLRAMARGYARKSVRALLDPLLEAHAS